MKKYLFDCGTRDATASLGLFVLRVTVGLMMLIGHGWGKIKNFDALKDEWFVPGIVPFSFMSPPVSLIATIGAEVGAAALLVLGLMTRPAAFVFAFAMVIAAFEVHAADPWFSQGGASKEMALLYLIPAIVLLLSGSGAWSLDAAIQKDGKRRRW